MYIAWTLGHGMCKIVVYSQGVSVFCSVYSLVAISYDRLVFCPSNWLVCVFYEELALLDLNVNHLGIR